MMMFARTVIGLMQAPGLITRAFQSESDDRREEESNNLTTGTFSRLMSIILASDKSSKLGK